MLNTWIASPNETLIGTNSARAVTSAPRPGASTKKSSSTGLVAGLDHEHVAAGAEAGQERLARKRREHRRERAVDRVSALPHGIGAGLRGQRMAGGDHAERLGRHDWPGPIYEE